MNQLLPDLYHWRAYNPDIGHDVDCYWARTGGVAYAVDPLAPAEGLEWFRGPRAPAHVYMTNRLHDRSCGTFARQFGATVWCPRAGLHEHADGSLQVTPYDPGQVLPGGVRALPVGVICPDETALLLPVSGGALAIADSFVRYGGRIAFVPDDLIGDDPEAVKAGTKAAFLRLCDECDFDHLLFAHGDPLIGGGREALRAFCRGCESPEMGAGGDAPVCGSTHSSRRAG